MEKVRQKLIRTAAAIQRPEKDGFASRQIRLHLLVVEFTIIFIHNIVTCYLPLLTELQQCIVLLLRTSVVPS